MVGLQECIKLLANFKQQFGDPKYKRRRGGYLRRG